MLDKRDRSDPSPGGWTTREVEDDESPSTAVVLAVARATDTDPTDLPTLNDVVDPEALDALFSPLGGSDREGEVSFEYAGHEVCVEARGVVRLRPVATAP